MSGTRPWPEERATFDRNSTSDALRLLFTNFNERPSPDRMATFVRQVKGRTPGEIWRGVDRLCNDASYRRLPPPAVLREAIRESAKPPGHEPRPTGQRHRRNETAAVGSLLHVDGPTTVVKCEWADGCESLFDADHGYLHQIARLNHLPGPRVHVLCPDHQRQYLDLQGQLRRREAEWAWPVLVGISRDRRPTQYEVDKLDRTGFQAERVQRMLRAGMLSSRER